MNFQQWSEKIAERTDITSSLVHLTKGTFYGGDYYDPLQVLLKIISERCIVGSTTKSGLIVGKTPAVCFQDAPISSVSQNCYYENKLRQQNKTSKVRYEAFGLRFTKSYVYQQGGRPVIYDRTKEAKEYLPESQWWKIVNLDLSNQDSIIDWTHEREWRVPNNFYFDTNIATLILPNDQQYKRFITMYKQSFNIEPFHSFYEIINMSSYLF